MSIYPFQRREQLLSEIARQADQNLFYRRNKEKDQLKRKNKANRLLLELKPRKLEWLAQTKPQTKPQTPAMENLTWKNITNDGKYSLD